MNENRVNAVTYIRTVPILDQDQDHQIGIITHYAELNGLYLSAQYIDESFGGINERRPALEQLLLDAKEKKFDSVLILSLDKVFRHSKHMVSVINELVQYDIGLISIQDGFDSSSAKGKETLHSVLQIFSLDRRMQNERIRIGIAQKKITAERTGSRWRVGRPQVDHELTQQIIDLRRQGLSLRAIERRLKRSVSKTTIGRIIKSARLRLAKAT